MFKCVHFKFDTLRQGDPWVNFCRFGALQSVEGNTYNRYEDVNLHLDPEPVYQIGLDQSTSNTGIFIKTFDNSDVYMIELSRDKFETAEDFVWKFEMVLRDLTQGCIISHLIYERPIDSHSYRSAQVLFQLEGTINGIVRRYPAFKNAKLSNIENSSWRSVCIPKELTSIYSRKESSYYAMLQLFPWTASYGASIGKDYDIFEAMGVMFGWFQCSFDHLGRPYVRGNSATKPVGGFCIPAYTSQQVVNMLAQEGIPAQQLIANPRYTLYKNIVSSLSDGVVSCVELTDSYAMLCMSIECNIKWMGEEVMTLIITDASTCPKRLKEIAGDEFHFVL